MVGSEDNNRKIKFILAWYNLEKKKLKDSQKLLLLNKWIDSLTKFEEYEIAEALLKEKIKLIRSIRQNNIGKRSFFNAVILFIKVLSRKYIRQ